MNPFLPDLFVSPGAVPSGSVPPGAAAPGLFTQPGAALRGGAGTAGTGLDFAGLLSAALPEGEVAAPALTNLPASVPGFGLPPRAAQPLPGPVVAAPPATRLPPGTILPDSGALVPQPDAPPVMSDAALNIQAPVETPTLPTETISAPPTPEAATPLIAVQLRADTSGEPQEQPDPIGHSESEEMEEAPLAPAAPVPVAAPVILAAAPPAPLSPARAAIRTDEPRAGPPVRAEHRAHSTPMPMQGALPETDGDTATTPAAATMLAEAPPPAAANPAQQPAPITTPLAPTPAAAPAMAERIEPRAPAPNQESAIAAVGEIREALRAARPEMTLRHADFGFVSLRVEPTGTQDWRAVLASRDPGFVPAIHAALAERAVAATADTASTSSNTGQNGTAQNGAGDQRYGASPNGGQGSSQPYLGHSPGRDEGQPSHPQNRQPSTTDAVASRASEADAERPDRSERGVFA